MRILILCFVVACSGSGSGGDVFTVGDAVDEFAPAACSRLQRCQAQFPYDSIETCAADLHARACSDRDCAAAYAGSLDDLDACVAAYDEIPCATTTPPPSCLDE